jgi:hypothetical protein
LIIRRGLDVPSGGTIPVLDFSAAEAFAPVATNLTITGLEPGEDFRVTNTLMTSTSTLAMIFGRAPVDGSALYSVPAAQLAPGDLHELWVGSALPDRFRTAIAYFHSPTDRTHAMGPQIATPTVTSVTTSPYVRLRARLPAQPEYGGAAQFIYGGLLQGGRNTGVSVTAAYLGGTPAMWDLVIPDLSGAEGFQSSWMPMEGQADAYQVQAYSGWELFGRVFRPAPVENDVIRYGVFTGALPSVHQVGARHVLVAPPWQASTVQSVESLTPGAVTLRLAPLR